MSASDLPKPDYVMYTREECGDLNFWNEASIRAYGDKRAREAVPEGYALGMKAAADWIAKRRADFIEAHGSVDPATGALEFGRGQHAELKAEYVGELEEIEEAIRALAAAPTPGEKT